MELVQDLIARFRNGLVTRQRNFGIVKRRANRPQ